MKIQLKGDLHPELIAIGLKPGDEIHQVTIHKNKAAHFTAGHHLAVPQNCSVWPDNYDILPEP